MRLPVRVLAGAAAVRGGVAFGAALEGVGEGGFGGLAGGAGRGEGVGGVHDDGGEGKVSSIWGGGWRRGEELEGCCIARL